MTGGNIMNKSLKRALASFVAAASLITSTVSIGANATSVMDARTAENYINELLEADRSDFYYTPYDYYDQYNLAPTEHYLSAIVPANAVLSGNFWAYFYLNTNIVSNTPTDPNNFTISPAYTPYATLSAVTSSTFTTTCKMISAKFNVLGNPSLPAALFSYDLEGAQNNTVVTDEYELYKLTSPSYNSPSTVIYTSNGYTFEKVVYALGDVDRDGDVDATDALNVQKYTLSMAGAFPGRTTTEAAYDQIAFELAADFNQDGQINMPDVVAILQYLGI